jgi:hypothetical protein
LSSDQVDLADHGFFGDDLFFIHALNIRAHPSSWFAIVLKNQIFVR